MAQKKLIKFEFADLGTIQTNIEFAAETIAQINKLHATMVADGKKILSLSNKYTSELNQIEKQIQQFDAQIKKLGIANKGFVEVLVSELEKLPSESAVGTYENAIKNVTTFTKL